MESNLSSLDLYFLAKELKSLENSRLDKVFSDGRRFVFSFYVFGKGKSYLHFTPPSTIYLSDKKGVESQESGFCNVLRKYLSGKKLQSIDQHGFERIILMDFGETRIILELFDKGNILLVKSDQTIISGLFFKKFRERTIRGGVKYELPKNKTNPLEVSFEDFQKLLWESKIQVVKILATSFSLGGKYAEELCKRAGVQKDSISPSKKECEAIFSALKGFFDEKQSNTLYNDGFSPIMLSGKTPVKQLESFSGIVEYIVRQEHQQIINEGHKIKKIKTIIGKQKELLSESIKLQEEYNLKGSKLYEYFQEIDALLKNINQTKQKQGWDAVKEKFANSKVKIDQHSGKITVKLP